MCRDLIQINLKVLLSDEDFRIFFHDKKVFQKASDT